MPNVNHQSPAWAPVAGVLLVALAVVVMLVCRGLVYYLAERHLWTP